MARCFLCMEEKDTRRVLIGRARGFADMCFDCALKFHKIRTEE